MQTPAFVTGPFPLTQRSLVVKSPEVAVLFRNGVAQDVLTPGVHRSILGQLPLFGQLDYLLFDAAPFGYTIAVNEIPLRDNYVVDLEAKVWVEPVWLANPQAIFSYAQQFGLRAERYLETVEESLYDILRRQILQRCSMLTHAEFIALELGPVLGLNQVTTDLARVSRVVGVTALQDPHVAERIRAHQSVENRAIADTYDLSMDRQRALAQAKMNAEIAELYGVDAWTVAHPDAANRIKLEHAHALRELITEYRDMLSPQDIQRAHSALFGVDQQIPPEPPPLGGGALPGQPPALGGFDAASVAHRLRGELAGNPALLTYGVGIAQAPGGSICCVAIVELPGGAGIGNPNEIAAREGLSEVNIVSLTQLTDAGSVAAELFDAAFSHAGMPAANLDVASAGGFTRVTISLTGPLDDAQAIALRLSAWTDALTEIVAPEQVQVDIQ